MELSAEEVLQFYAFTHEMRGVLETILDKRCLTTNERKLVEEAHDKLLVYRENFMKKVPK